MLRGIARRLQVPALERHHSKRWVLGLFALVNGVVSIGSMSAAAAITGDPLVFPSLGPTAFLLFYKPTEAVASPRNAIVGHLIGIAAGYLALLLFGIAQRGPALALGLDWGVVGAAALSLGLTNAAMVWLDVPHPPAAATTLIVALGILHRPWQLGVLMLGVVLLVVQGFAINRLAGIAYPTWARSADSEPPAGGERR